MAKLGKREMIILGAAAVLVLIAAVDFFMPKKKIPMVDVAQKKIGHRTLFWTASHIKHGARARKQPRKGAGQRRRSSLSTAAILKCGGNEWPLSMAWNTKWASPWM